MSLDFKNSWTCLRIEHIREDFHEDLIFNWRPEGWEKAKEQIIEEGMQQAETVI